MTNGLKRHKNPKMKKGRWELMHRGANFPLIGASWRRKKYKRACHDDMTSMKRRPRWIRATQKLSEE